MFSFSDYVHVVPWIQFMLYYSTEYKTKPNHEKIVHMYVCIRRREGECQRYKISPKLSSANPCDRNEEKVMKF